jgi:hypothetical protein
MGAVVCSNDRPSIQDRRHRAVSLCSDHSDHYIAYLVLITLGYGKNDR